MMETVAVSHAELVKAVLAELPHVLGQIADREIQVIDWGRWDEVMELALTGLSQTPDTSSQEALLEFEQINNALQVMADNYVADLPIGTRGKMKRHKCKDLMTCIGLFAAGLPQRSEYNKKGGGSLEQIDQRCIGDNGQSDGAGRGSDGSYSRTSRGNRRKPGCRVGGCVANVPCHRGIDLFTANAQTAL